MFKRKQTTQGIVEVIRTDNADVLRMVEASHKEGMLLAERQAKQDATTNKPPLKGVMPIYLKFLLAFYNKIVTEVKTAIQSNHHTYSANKEIEAFKKTVSRLQEKLTEVINELRITKHSFEDLKSCLQVIRASRRAQVIVLLLTTAELILSATSFQMIATNMLFALILGTVFAGALYASAILGAKFLRKATNRIQFYGILSIIITILGTLFWSLGQLRISYLTEMSDTGQISEQLSPFAFVFFQLFLFVTAIMIKYVYMPTKQEKEQYHTWREAKNKVNALEKQKLQLETEIQDTEKQLQRSLIARKTLISFASYLEKRIDSKYQEAGYHYIKENLHRRSDADKGTPQLFSLKNPLEPLTLYFQDEESLLNFNEALLEHEN